ncbi:MAG: hypothetical protein LBJ15_22550 [Comamonas sp.]|jgi:hypothetical protein|uniref:hypothetical protein n=1 Tax=Comamonas sp. TaxID=34028 RepID=UPI0028330C55|nr:hypothetical protein [Comamonas sp.]MDR0216766.1 hypothetical protein [Comamonas sp.]
MSSLQSSHIPSVEYLAVVESFAVNPDGSLNSEELTWIVDAVPTSALNRLARELTDSREENYRSRIDFLTLIVQADNRLINAFNSDGFISIKVTQRAPTSQVEILAFATDLNDSDNENLPFSIRISQRPPNRRHVRTLKQLAKFSHIPDATDFSDFEIAGDQGTAVAVYDVGQASMCAVVDSAEHPLIFFDLGWPASFNKISKPSTDFAPLKAGRPMAPVVLSHLDWDHWAFAHASGRATWNSQLGAWTTTPKYRAEALSRKWLLRRPKYASHSLGPSHIHFIQELGANGVLQFWPSKRKRLNLGAVTIFPCNPQKGSKKSAAFLRNNQGLAMLVTHKTGARVLLPGDADYPSIPTFATKGLTGLVASHHGGKVQSGSIPNAVGHGRMVMSVHGGCYPSIPHADTTDEAEQKGWQILRTDDRCNCFRSSKPFSCGNRLIRLDVTPMCTCMRIPNHCACIR